MPELSVPISPAQAPGATPEKRRGAWFSLDNRFIPPLFITCILLIGQLSFGMLESYQKTVLAIVASIATELFLGRIFTGVGLVLGAAATLMGLLFVVLSVLGIE